MAHDMTAEQAVHAGSDRIWLELNDAFSSLRAPWSDARKDAEFTYIGELVSALEEAIAARDQRLDAVADSITDALHTLRYEPPAPGQPAPSSVQLTCHDCGCALAVPESGLPPAPVRCAQCAHNDALAHPKHQHAG